MKRLVLACLVVVVATVLVATTAFAQPKPTFQLGFEALAEQIPTVVGEPIENEHWGANGDSLQQTTTGLMVWRKADNFTCFTDGTRSWINGPLGVQERANEERFSWEATPLAPTAPTAVPTPAPTPSPTSVPAPVPPRVTYTNPNVIQGQVVYADTAWALGEIHNEGGVAAYNVSVSGRLLSASGSVAGADTDHIPYLGPGDTIAYELAIKNPSAYVKAEISVNAEAKPGSYMTYMKGNVSNLGLRKADEYFRVAGITTNGNNVPIRNMQVRTWFLDAQNNVVDVTTNYFGSDLAPGGSTNFDEKSNSVRYNPRVGTTTQGKVYVFGYK